MTFDDTYRVGRCPNTRCLVRMGEGWRTTADRPAYAWKAVTGLRVDDGMRCPNCGSALNKTSREARHMREFTEDELLKVFEQTLKTLRERTERNQEQLDAWKLEPDSDRREVFVEAYERYLENSWKDWTRVDDGFRRWMSSGSDEHDALVKSGW